MFVHLHTHSCYSLLRGTMKIDTLLGNAQKLGFTYLALTDRNALYGAIEFYQQALEIGIQPIIGSEITFTDQTLLLLVRNQKGYSNLCHLLSLGHLQGGHLGFKLELKDLITYKKGLTVLSAGKVGLLWKQVNAHRLAEAQTYCRQMKRIFGRHFFIELQHFQQSDLMMNLRLRDLGRQYEIPLAATNDVYLANRQEQELHAVLRAVDENTLIERITERVSAEQYLKPANEMQRLFKQFPDAIRNTKTIASQCEFSFGLNKHIFPSIDLPDSETSYSYLWKAAFSGAQERYHILTQELTARLTTELNTINALGFSDYFLIVKDIVEFCHRERIPCIGRGSAGDSLVSYVLGITQADPLRYNLYFERFLNRERSDMPDIDLDLCWKNRDRVIRYVYDTYGSAHTAMICTFSRFKLRSSIRDIARCYGFPEDEIGAITRYLPHYSRNSLSKALSEAPECRHIRTHADVLEQVLDFAQQIAGYPRHCSIHSGGIIIAPDDIRNYTPLQVAGKGIITSHYDMYSVEPLGLVKMDLLGVRSLSVITDCLEDIRKASNRVRDDPLKQIVCRYDLEGRHITLEPAASYLTQKRFPFLDTSKSHISPLDLRMIPENDPNVIALLREGMSMGCFQTESPAMRGLLQKMQIDGMEDVIISVALIRPGAADSGMKEKYIARRAGLETVDYIHPLLKPVLEESYGSIIYQEQVMQIAAAVAGFTLSEADVLRRAMTKSRNHETLDKMRKRFNDGAKEKGLSKSQTETVWKFLGNFVGYGFNKAHSCTYGVIAYQTAFLKCYFPVPYMTAVLNNQGGFYSLSAYISECRRMGIKLLPPDVQQSERVFICTHDTIITGLESVHELTIRTQQRIVEQRRESQFRDYYDFINRVTPREGEVENLIKCGALRSLNPNEPELLLRNKFYFKNKRRRSLTEAMMEQVRLQPYAPRQAIYYELELLGFAITDHPLTLYTKHISANTITSFQLEENKGKRVTFIGWMVTSRRVTTQNKELMKFLTLEDLHGLCEVVLFAQTYSRYGHLVKGPGPYRIHGTIQSRIPGEANLIADKIDVL
ncbi:MAG: DNA polymerase III subunit alpha [Calditrichia bacterium]